jgi:GGDEF domain-containing protein
MKVFTYSQARQALATVLDTARKEEVLIARRGGDTFAVTYKTTSKSPFDVPGIKTRATTQDILEAIRESRSRGAEAGAPGDG